MANDLSQEGEPPPMDFRSFSEDGRYPLGSGSRISMPVDPSQEEAEVRIDFRPRQEMDDILWTLCFPPEPDPISFTGTKPKKVDTHGTEESESITRADLAQALKSVQGGGGGSGGTGGAGGSGGGGRGRGRGKARASTSRGGRGSRARSKKKKGSSEYGAVATSAKAKAEKTCQAFNSGACSLRNCSKGTHK